LFVATYKSIVCLGNSDPFACWPGYLSAQIHCRFKPLYLSGIRVHANPNA
jgi:hypothetical protein